jgi:hypothetical protein
MLFTVLITVPITSLSSEHNSFVACDSRCIMHIASGADRVTEARSPLFPAITRATAVHNPTQSDNFMLLFIFNEIIDRF